jgi:hypothetical protein
MKIKNASERTTINMPFGIEKVEVFRMNDVLA